MKNEFKFLGFIALAIVIVFSLVSCGGSGFKVLNNNSADFTVANRTQWKEAINAIMSGGDNKTYTINVIGDFSMPGSSVNTFGNLTGITITITGDKKISLAEDSVGYLLNINSDQTVILQDVDLQGHDANSYVLVFMYDGKAFIMRGSASVSGNSFRGVAVDGGTFTMQDNASVNNNTITGRSGGGVYVGNGATFIMQDNASIYGNTAVAITERSNRMGGNGGGVYVDGTLIMEGDASIYGNKASDSGGGVFKDGSFRIVGGTIYGSDAEEGYKNTANRGTALYDESYYNDQTTNNTIKVIGGKKQ
jgi:hypothetical protein